MDPPPAQPPPPPSPPPRLQPSAPSRRYGLHFSASSFIQAPLSALLEYSGILRPDPGGGPHQAGRGTGEVSIRIVGSDEAGASSERAEEVIVEEHQEGPARTAQPAQPALAASGAEGGLESSSPYQRYDIQQVARWVEHILPFSLLLLVVFIRQHLQGHAQLSSFQECKTDRIT
jgi:E3 ubiquitin-protein ligase RNFT1